MTQPTEPETVQIMVPYTETTYGEADFTLVKPDDLTMEEFLEDIRVGNICPTKYAIDENWLETDNDFNTFLLDQIEVLDNNGE